MSSAFGNRQNLLHCMEIHGGHGNAINYFRRPGLDIWVWTQSRGVPQQEGGDVHYISSCASGRITRMLLADVGGVDNLFSRAARGMYQVMKRNINLLSQTWAVQQLTAEMERTARQGGFISALLTTYFSPTRSLTICNAGHPPPLHYRAASGQWQMLRSATVGGASGDTLSGIAAPSEFQRLRLKLHPGDFVFCYSNALAECRQAQGRTLGVLGLQRELASIAAHSPSEQTLHRHMQRLKELHADNLRDNDATAILCQATCHSVPVRDNMLAPFRLLRGTTDRTIS